MSLKLSFIPDNPMFLSPKLTEETPDIFEENDFKYLRAQQEDLIALLLIQYSDIRKSYVKNLNKPYLHAQLTIENTKYEVSFDNALFSQLTKLYFIYGWKVIKAIETNYKYSWWIEKPNNVLDYFTLTKKTISIIIRHSLINIEIKARNVIKENLKTQSRRLNAALIDYDFQLNYDPFSEEYSYNINNNLASNNIFDWLTKAVNSKSAIDETLKRNIDAKRTNEFVNFLVFLFSGGESLTNSSYNPLLNPFSQDTESLNTFKKDLIDSLTKLGENHFLALLMFTKLEKNFGKSEMENELYNSCMVLKKNIEEILGKLNENKTSSDQFNKSRIEVLIKWDEAEKLNIEKFENIENSIEEIIIFDFEKNENISLLSVDVLDHLVKYGLVDKDSFEYPVLFQYKDCLIKHIEKKDAEQKSNDELWNKISVCNSILTLSSAIPVIGEITGPISLIIDLGLLFHTVTSINSRLNKLSNLTKQNLIAANPSDELFSNAMIETGALMNQSITIKDEIFTQITLEILILLVGASAENKLIHKAIAWRIYAYDIESLYDSSN